MPVLVLANSLSLFLNSVSIYFNYHGAKIRKKMLRIGNNFSKKMLFARNDCVASFIAGCNTTCVRAISLMVWS